MSSIIDFFNYIFQIEFFNTLFKLLLACFLGALIGFERESIHRPAGLRTHALVCVGSCLVMLTSEYIFNTFYNGIASADVARLGAQVISGIGFLGAGTILRQDNGVKGLTTAASLWAVACIGLATGIGYYEGAIISSIIVYVILIFFRPLANKSHLYDDDKNDDNDVE